MNDISPQGSSLQLGTVTSDGNTISNEGPNPSSDQSRSPSETPQETETQEKDLKGLLGVPGPQVVSSTLLALPESIVLSNENAPVPPSIDDYKAAVDKAKNNPDVQTVFFVNFVPTGIESEPLARVKLRTLQSQVESWQAWSSTICEGKVKQQMDKNDLPTDDEGDSKRKRSTYRSKVFDYVMNASTWFSMVTDMDLTKHISVKSFEFHAAILTAVLEGLAIPTSVYTRLEGILHNISDGILKASTINNAAEMQYWIMMTTYDYRLITNTVESTIRAISFKVSKKIAEYALNKNKYPSVSLDLNFRQTVYEFNSRVYQEIQESLDNQLVDAGLELVKKNTWDIPV